MALADSNSSAKPRKQAGQARPERRKRRTQAERSQQTQEKLLEAALGVMLKRGYVGLRLAEVADEAGTSRGALLHHYPSKDDLVLATVEYAYSKALARTLAMAKESRRSSDLIAGIIEDGRQFFFSEFFFLLTDIRVSTSKSEAIQKKSRELALQFRLPAEQAWKNALVESGMQPRLAEDIVWLTMSVVRGFAVRTHMRDEPQKFQRLLDLWREILWTYCDATAGKPSARARSSRD